MCITQTIMAKSQRLLATASGGGSSSSGQQTQFRRLPTTVIDRISYFKKEPDADRRVSDAMHAVEEGATTLIGRVLLECSAETAVAYNFFQMSNTMVRQHRKECGDAFRREYVCSER